MIKLNLVTVGKLKDDFIRKGVSEYLKRLSLYAKVTEYEIKEENDPKESDVKKTLDLEGKRILEKCKGKIFALAVEGKMYSSEGFSKRIKKCVDSGDEITFVVGSSRGLSDIVKSRADALISFSDMTFPHGLFRLMLVEQIYRAFTIINGTGYHK